MFELNLWFKSSNIKRKKIEEIIKENILERFTMSCVLCIKNRNYVLYVEKDKKHIRNIHYVVCSIYTDSSITLMEVNTIKVI